MGNCSRPPQHCGRAFSYCDPAATVVCDFLDELSCAWTRLLGLALRHGGCVGQEGAARRCTHHFCLLQLRHGRSTAARPQYCGTAAILRHGRNTAAWPQYCGTAAIGAETRGMCGGKVCAWISKRREDVSHNVRGLGNMSTHWRHMGLVGERRPHFGRNAEVWRVVGRVRCLREAPPSLKPRI